MTSILIKRETDIDKQKKECHVMMEAEIGVMYLQAKKHKTLPATPEAKRKV